MPHCPHCNKECKSEAGLKSHTKQSSCNMQVNAGTKSPDTGSHSNDQHNATPETSRAPPKQNDHTSPLNNSSDQSLIDAIASFRDEEVNQPVLLDAIENLATNISRITTKTDEVNITDIHNPLCPVHVLNHRCIHKYQNDHTNLMIITPRYLNEIIDEQLPRELAHWKTEFHHLKHVYTLILRSKTDLLTLDKSIETGTFLIRPHITIQGYEHDDLTSPALTIALIPIALAVTKKVGTTIGLDLLSHYNDLILTMKSFRSRIPEEDIRKLCGLANFAARKTQLKPPPLPIITGLLRPKLGYTTKPIPGPNLIENSTDARHTHHQTGVRNRSHTNREVYKTNSSGNNRFTRSRSNDRNPPSRSNSNYRDQYTLRKSADSRFRSNTKNDQRRQSRLDKNETVRETYKRPRPLSVHWQDQQRPRRRSPSPRDHSTHRYSTVTRRRSSPSPRGYQYHSNNDYDQRNHSYRRHEEMNDRHSHRRQSNGDRSLEYRNHRYQRDDRVYSKVNRTTDY